MAAPTNTLLIEGSFTELVDELAQYADALRNKTQTEGSSSSDVRSEIAPTLESLREKEQEQAEQELSVAQNQEVLKERDEVMKKVVVACAALNSAPEKGVFFLLYFQWNWISWSFVC